MILSVSQVTLRLTVTVRFWGSLLSANRSLSQHLDKIRIQGEFARDQAPLKAASIARTTDGILVKAKTIAAVNTIHLPEVIVAQGSITQKL